MHSPALKYFLAVAKWGSISEATRHLNVAGSAVSRQVANLEAELGCLLFERRPKGMVLTEEGRILARYAQRATIDSQQVLAEIQEIKGVSRGHVRIASTEAFALGVLPSTIASFQKRHPHIRFDLTITAPAEIDRLVIEGDADLGITFAITPTVDLSVAYRMASDLVALMHCRHPLARRQEVTLHDLSAHATALPGPTSTSRQLFDAACALEGLMISPRITANTLWALLPYVATDEAVTIGAALSIPEYLRGTVVARPIVPRSGLARSIEIQSMKGRQLPAAPASFAAHLIEYLQQLGAKA